MAVPNKASEPAIVEAATTDPPQPFFSPSEEVVPSVAVVEVVVGSEVSVVGSEVSVVGSVVEVVPVSSGDPLGAKLREK